MADTIRQQIVEKIKARFQNITVSNGYQTNLGQNVFLWRLLNPAAIQAHEVPCCSIRDTENEAFPQVSGRADHHQTLTITVDLADIAITEADKNVRNMIADIYKAIGVDIKWSGLAFNTLPKKDLVGIDQQEKIVGMGQVTFQIEYRTQRFNPLAQ